MVAGGTYKCWEGNTGGKTEGDKDSKLITVEKTEVTERL
jgi:hypothetical protein